MTDMPVVFKIFQILIPTLVLIIFCVGLCKGIKRAWRKRRDQEDDQVFVQEGTSVYVIPALPPAQGLDSTSYRPPPSYDELILKPDLAPSYPPPSYSESVSPPPFCSQPALIPPPYSCSQDLEPNARTPT